MPCRQIFHWRHGNAAYVVNEGKAQMRPYFEKMPGFGKPLKENRIRAFQGEPGEARSRGSADRGCKEAKEEVGIPAAKINERGALTVWQRLEYLVDPGTLAAAAQSLQPGGERRGHDQRGRRPGKDLGPLGGDHRLRQQGPGRGVDSRTGGRTC